MDLGVCATCVRCCPRTFLDEVSAPLGRGWEGKAENGLSQAYRSGFPLFSWRLSLLCALKQLIMGIRGATTLSTPVVHVINTRGDSTLSTPVVHVVDTRGATTLHSVHL